MYCLPHASLCVVLPCDSSSVVPGGQSVHSMCCSFGTTVCCGVWRPLPCAPRDTAALLTHPDLGDVMCCSKTCSSFLSGSVGCDRSGVWWSRFGVSQERVVLLPALVWPRLAASE
ncbi:hypothetical protein E2C01_027219 [Portunus trituberculatus]|uniref:Uncharacterized protein n=1 Tax=Portunus trituberculatus TaxID=210409 RepID=A0A5B7EI67_PORTR|nr:hypothetical protein [Portunus trituberculatus]